MDTVITVTGEQSANDLGVTLPHEHLIIDASIWVPDGPELTAIQRRKLEESVSMENLWWLAAYGRQPKWNSLDNRRLDDVETAKREAMRFVAEGGETLVDVTPMSPGLGRDPGALKRIANHTGLNVVAGTGHYVRHAHPPRIDDQSASEIADEMVGDIVDGIDGTGVRAGVIGEIGATNGFSDHPNEKTVFRAAAIAQQRTGAPITIHPPVHYKEGHDVLDVLEEAGANLTNVILGHLDGAMELDNASAYYDSLAERGVSLEFDTFGRIGYIASEDVCFPLDETRIRELRRLFDKGYGDQLLVSHDICKKNQLTKYAGHGYDYILRDIVPRLRRREFSETEITSLLVDNPARALTIEE
ncbi:MAG: putative metal-dependent hydrolase [uncultured archaeon A07HR67]|jgi:Predicted metal-dependent hydrolase with the TIM-barrel fold|nr:MAG: putative metal-dependent hydrolase [uncultured archaeon A07HR67]